MIRRKSIVEPELKFHYNVKVPLTWMETVLLLWKKFPNQDLLGFAATSFFIFLVAELIAASISGSLSLLADAVAMYVNHISLLYYCFSHCFFNPRGVDVATYGCNMLAERAKERESINSYWAKLYTEILIPLFAMLTLLLVTCYFTSEAVRVLQRPDRGEDKVNIVYLYTFSLINLVVDILCIGMFCVRGREVFIERQQSVLPQLSLDTSVHSEGSDEFGALDDDDFFNEIDKEQEKEQHPNSPEKRNLNMMSAFVHMGGDSLRTAAVLAAALISTLSGASSDLCDAWSAIVVSLIIVLLMVPLAVDIARSAVRLSQESRDYAPVNDEDQDELIV